MVFVPLWFKFKQSSHLGPSDAYFAACVVCFPLVVGLTSLLAVLLQYDSSAPK